MFNTEWGSTKEIIVSEREGREHYYRTESATIVMLWEYWGRP